MKKSDNQNIMPFSTKINEENHLTIGGCDVVDLADKYSTPLYIIDEQTIRRIAQQYKEAFSQYEKVNMLFASKALMTKAIAKILDNEGFGFDVVSGGEIYTVLQSGVNPAKLLFNGGNKTIEELEWYIYEHGYYNIEDVINGNYIEEELRYMSSSEKAIKSQRKRRKIVCKLNFLIW